MKTILGIKVANRFEEVDRMQTVFTDHGSIIKARLGLHTELQGDNANEGLILLELNEGAPFEKIENDLGGIEGLEVRKMSFS